MKRSLMIAGAFEGDWLAFLLFRGDEEVQDEGTAGIRNKVGDNSLSFAITK